MKNEVQKKLVSHVLKDLERLLHGAIDENRVGNLNVFEMIMVTADTLNNAYKNKKAKKKEAGDNVVQFRKK